MWALHLPGEPGYFWACPPPAPCSCPRWVWREGSRARVSQGLEGLGAGPRKPEGLGAAFSPSSPAPEEPQLARNVNKEETALAKQRPHDSSRPKQRPPGPRPPRKTSQAFVRARSVIITAITEAGQWGSLGRPARRETLVESLGIGGTASAAQAHSRGQACPTRGPWSACGPGRF